MTPINPIFQMAEYIDRDTNSIAISLTMKTRSDFALWCVRHVKNEDAEQLVCSLAIRVYDWWRSGPLDTNMF